MKYILLLLLIVTNYQTTHAQKKLEGLIEDSAKLYIEYNAFDGFLNDSTYEKLSKLPVFLGNKAAVYTYQTRSPEAFLNELREKADPRFITPEEEVASFKRHYDVEKVVSTVWIKYYRAPDYLKIRKYNDGDVWLSDTAIYDWSLAGEFKIVNSYKCQKATTKNKKNEDIVVWFTEDIPISAGPVFLTGLPGLILETYNSTTGRLIRATTITSTNIPRQFFRKWLKGPIVTREEDREIYQGESAKAKQFLKMLQDSKNSN